ncbi:MAG: ArsR/SmtB family transcription factor [Planctomycetota bacterium]|jgi:predicted transcriptional regulator
MGQSERRLERIAKGFANHRRIEILALLQARSDLAVHEIATRLRINLKTASEHIRRMNLAGLVHKRNYGRSVRHVLTKRGEHVLTFLRTLE